MASRDVVDAGQLSELRTALRQVSDEIGDVVASLMEDIAGDVAADARRRVPRRSGRAQASYRSRGTSIESGDGVPYVPWLEFGGRVGRKKTTTRARVPGGRYLYPAIAENAADVAEKVSDLIEQVSGGYLEVEGR